MMNAAKIFDSLQFACEAHKDQRRKGAGGSPYINHLIEVSSLLVNVANVDDIDVIIAAVLHDILEDTSVTESDIQSRFGDTVLHYVKSVSDNKGLSLAARRKIQLDKIANSSEQIKLIKLSDHCSNIASIPPNWDYQRVISYLDWSRKVSRGCYSASEKLGDEYKKRLVKAEKYARSLVRTGAELQSHPTDES